MNIVAIRHGETEGNVQHIVQSRTGGTLTERGRAQALEAGANLRSERFDVVISSDLKRCIETTELVLAKLPHTPYISTERIRERNQGVYEGGRWEDLPWLSFEGDNLTTEIPEGESWLQVEARIAAFLNDLYEEYPNANVLLVTHGGVLKALRALVEDMTLRQSVDEPILNGSIWRGVMSAPVHTTVVR